MCFCCFFTEKKNSHWKCSKIVTHSAIKMAIKSWFSSLCSFAVWNGLGEFILNFFFANIKYPSKAMPTNIQIPLTQYVEL